MFAHHGRYSRRGFLLGAAAFGCTARAAQSHLEAKALYLVLAPSNLGLRLEPNGMEPGTWQAPAALMAAGLQRIVQARSVVQLPCPPYETREQSGTRIRNGRTLREFSLALARSVRTVLGAGGFPLVIGGDCSILLGCLYGLRLAGGQGLIHIDGHSDFYHPGNYDTSHRLGSAAGMDLALATGRGEPLLTQWPGLDGPLAKDEHTLQLGERDALAPGYTYADIQQTGIRRFIAQEILREGVERTARGVIEYLQARNLRRAWMHVDLDVLDQTVMPAVDSPGSPGLTFSQLSSLLSLLFQSGCVAGADIAIYDPTRDADRRYAAPIVAVLKGAFT